MTHERFAQRQPPLDGRSIEPVPGLLLSSPAPRGLLRVDGIDAAALPPATNELHRISIAPDCWMLVGESADAQTLRHQLEILPDDTMVTDLSHGWARIRAQGAAASELLQHGIDLDLHTDAWPVGQGTATAYRNMPILLHAPIAECFDVYTLRSLAECLWEWIVDAAGGIGNAGDES